MNAKLTPPQAALLSRLPDVFVVVESTKGTEIRHQNGQTAFHFTTGHSRAFKSLWNAGHVLDVEKAEKPNKDGYRDTTFMKA